MSNLHNKIMRRVYVIYGLRKIFSPGMLKFYVASVLVWQLFARVSVIDVFQNFAGTGNDIGYLGYAILDTESVVQLIIFGTVVTLFLLAKDLVKATNGKELAFRMGHEGR